MKTQYKFLKTILGAAVLLFAFGSCERELSEDAVFATYSTTGEIFTDNFVGMGADFFFPYNDGYAKAEILAVDTDVSYVGSSSMRIDVPHATNDPEGSYAGATFEVDGGFRNLTEYNALSFWAKASRSANIQAIGFGQDGEGSVHEVAVSGLNFDTTWRKYMIPIPDPSKLVQESGMLHFVMTDNEESSYSVWFDEIKFENSGLVGAAQSYMLGGGTNDWLTATGQTLDISGFSHNYTLGDGTDVTVSSTSAYYSFKTSDPSVAIVSESGKVTAVGIGTAEITATVAGRAVEGVLVAQVFENVPVISLFSDLYANVPVDGYNGFWGGFQTTLGGAVTETNGNNIIQYTNLNYVGMEFYGRYGPEVQPVDVTEMTHFHIDVRVDEALQPGDFVNFSTDK